MFLAYFEYKAARWMERETAQGRQASSQLTEGLQSHVRSQAQLQRDMASRFATMWAPLRSEIATEELTGLEGPVVDGKDANEMDEAEMDGLRPAARGNVLRKRKDKMTICGTTRLILAIILLHI
jgi:hypothetical protein